MVDRYFGFELEKIPDTDKMPKELYMRMYNSVGAAMEVYNELHNGMEESIYQEALELELSIENIPFERQKPLHTWYKGKQLEKTYFADIVTYDNIILELKSVSEICSEHRSQLFNYLKITKSKCGVLINFGGESFYSERYWFVDSLDDYVLLRKDNLRYVVANK